jgi:hypothetical protein
MTDPTHLGYTIFCDDIRNEMGGKTSFVGVYENEMFIHGDFPCLLPKFGLGIRYMEKRGAYKSQPVTLRIYLPGDEENTPSLEAPISQIVEARKNLKAHPDADQKAPRYLKIATNLIIAPLVIAKPGDIKVRAQCGSKIVKLGTLLVVRGESTASPPA